MTKVINGKIYRTHTAQLIVTLPSPFPKTSNKWHETQLYWNQRGAYFLAGEGGSSSRWKKITPRGASEGIEPLSKDEALAYAKDAGLSPDRFAQAGFARDEDHWLVEGQRASFEPINLFHRHTTQEVTMEFSIFNREKGI